MISYGATDIGKRRKINQDYLFYSDGPVGCFPNLYIVADGMGGHKAGDKASSYAVERFVELSKAAAKEMPFLVMEKLIHQVNEEVYQMSAREEEYAGMGTTFVAVTVMGRTAYVMNIGDSRLYYYADSLKQVTMDHSLVEELVRAGELDRAKCRNHPQKNIITRAVGVTDTVQPDFFMFEMTKGQKLLLCSDGLSNMVEDDRLEEILSGDENVETIARTCIDEALFYGGVDNIAVVVARYGDGR